MRIDANVWKSSEREMVWDFDFKCGRPFDPMTKYSNHFLFCSTLLLDFSFPHSTRQKWSKRKDSDNSQNELNSMNSFFEFNKRRRPMKTRSFHSIRYVRDLRFRNKFIIVFQQENILQFTLRCHVLHCRFVHESCFVFLLFGLLQFKAEDGKSFWHRILAISSKILASTRSVKISQWKMRQKRHEF